MNTDPMRGDITNESGHFRFEDLPVGRYTLKISYVGYEEAVLSELLLGSARELVVEVDLREKSQSPLVKYLSTTKRERPSIR